MKKIGINIIGYVNKKFGLGQAVRSNISAIKSIKIPLSVNNFTLSNEIEEILVESSNNNPYQVNLVQINFDKLPELIREKNKEYFEKKYNIGYWVWETENFPDQAKVFFDFFDEIWTASDFCVEAISKKVSIPVFKVPHPVSFDFEKYITSQVNEKFVFLTMFDYNSSINRKNPSDAIIAFEKAFGKNNPKVELIIKTSKSDNFQEEKSKLLHLINSNTSIKIIEEILSETDLYKLIGSCNCFVSLHKSEGFGLTMGEAMLMGKPVIATAYSANTDFMNLNNSYLVGYEMEKIGSNYYFNSETDYWAKPNINCAVKQMKEVFENQNEAIEIGKLAQKEMLMKYNNKY
ncbi:glycosyltransferase, partial [Flavobacterium psychrophilum]|nr:glycosyltransferase [Flavobacterium psychrophilum]